MTSAATLNSPFVPSSIELVEMRPSRDWARAVSTSFSTSLELYSTRTGFSKLVLA